VSISQREIARLAKVSPSTVSLALRNHFSIPISTRLRIQKIAKNAGYQPDAILAEIMAQKRKSAQTQASIAFFYTDEVSPFEQPGSPRDYARGVAARCAELGYGLDTFRLTDAQVTPKRQAAILRARGIKGLIIFWNKLEPIARCYAPLYEHFACAVIGTRPLSPLLSVAKPDHYKIGFVAFQWAKERGFQRPCALIEPSHDELTDYRFSLGCAAAQKTLNFANPIHTLVASWDSPEIPLWLDRHRPDFLLFGHYEIAMRRDMPPWNRMQLYHWDLTEPFQQLGLSGVDNSHDKAGASGVNLVVAQIHRNEGGIPPVQECVLVEGRHSIHSAKR